MILKPCTIYTATVAYCEMFLWCMQVALMRNDGTMYDGFYDRQLVVTVTSEPGSPSSTVPEDKQIIPDDNILNYEIMPGMTDRIIRISVS